jgi:hypothetical protein
MPLNYLDDEQDIYPPPTNWDALRRQQAILTGQPDGADDEGFDSAQQQPSPIAGGMRIPAGNPQPAPQIPLPAPDPVELQRQKAQQARQGVTDLAGKAPVQQKPTGVGGVLRGIAAAGLGAAAGYSNAAGRTRQPIDVSGITNTLVDPGLKRRQAQYQQQMTGAQAKQAAEEQNLADLEKAGQIKGQEGVQAANVAHLNAQTAALPSQAITAAVERGGEVVADGQAAPQGREGTVMNIGGKTVFFPSAGQKEKDKKLADQATWQQVTPEMADALKDLGVATGEKVPPAVFNQYQRIIQNQGKAPKLNFEHFTNENTGDVTTVGYDPISGEEKSRSVIKGVAQKRPAASISVGNSVDQDTIDFQARKYLQSGTLPQGAGRNPMLSSRILTRATQIAKEQGLDPEATGLGAAAFKANTQALNRLQTQRNQVLTFERTASSNLDLADNVSKTVDRTGSPLVNKYLLFVKGQIAGDTDTTKLKNAVTTAASEYAKVISGGTGSAAATDSTRREAEEMLNAAFSKGTFSAVVAQMKQEMQNRRGGFDGQIDELNRAIGARPGGDRGDQQPPPPTVNPNPNGYVKGHVYGGLTYLGGDPNNQASWKK